MAETLLRDCQENFQVSFYNVNETTKMLLPCFHRRFDDDDECSVMQFILFQYFCLIQIGYCDPHSSTAGLTLQTPFYCS